MTSTEVGLGRKRLSGVQSRNLRSVLQIALPQNPLATGVDATPKAPVPQVDAVWSSSTFGIPIASITQVCTSNHCAVATR